MPPERSLTTKRPHGFLSNFRKKRNNNDCAVYIFFPAALRVAELEANLVFAKQYITACLPGGERCADASWSRSAFGSTKLALCRLVTKQRRRKCTNLVTPPRQTPATVEHTFTGLSAFQPHDHSVLDESFEPALTSNIITLQLSRTDNINGHPVEETETTTTTKDPKGAVIAETT